MTGHGSYVSRILTGSGQLAAKSLSIVFNKVQTVNLPAEVKAKICCMLC